MSYSYSTLQKYEYLRQRMSEEEVNDYIHRWMFMKDESYKEIHSKWYDSLLEKKNDIYKHKQDLMIVLKRKGDLSRERQRREDTVSTLSEFL